MTGNFIPVSPPVWCEWIRQKIPPWMITASDQWPDEMGIFPLVDAWKHGLLRRQAMAIGATDEPISPLA